VVRLRDGGQGGGQVLAEGDAIEAHDAQLPRHLQTRQVRGAQGADGEQVVGTEQGRGATRAAQRGGDLLDRRFHERHFDQRQRLQAGRGHAVQKAAVAQLRPIAGGALPAHHGDAPVAECGQPGDGLGERLDAVDADARMGLVAVVGEHVAHAIALQLPQGH
jgi:hypothetical protein